MSAEMFLRAPSAMRRSRAVTGRRSSFSVLVRTRPRGTQKCSRCVAHYAYAPALAIADVAAELYDEVGSISMTLINAKIRRVRTQMQR